MVQALLSSPSLVPFSDHFFFFLFFQGGSSVDEELTQLYQNGERLAYFDFTGSGLFTQTQIKKVADMLANRFLVLYDLLF